MKRSKSILIKTLIQERCEYLLLEAVAYANMDDTQLADAYNQALLDYQQAQQMSYDFQMQIANNARTIYDKELDITRDMYEKTDYAFTIEDQDDLDWTIRRDEKYNKRRGLKPGDEGYRDPTRWKIGDKAHATRSNKVYIPGIGKNMNREQFTTMMRAIKNGDKGSFEYGGKTYKGADAIRDHFGIHPSWGIDQNGNFRLSTTDNTCAAFTCAVLDYTQAQQQETTPGFNISLTQDNKGDWMKTWTNDEWEQHLNNTKTKYLNTKTYMASPEKITRAAADNANVWGTYNMDDFQKGLKPGDEGYLDPYGEEFWDKYVKPGDMIIYHNKGTDPGAVSAHIAIAGHNNRQIYHDGSTTNNVQVNSDKNPHGDYKNKSNYSHFTIIRYENKSNIDELQANLTAIQNEIDNRGEVFANNYMQNDDGSYESTAIDQLDTKEVETITVTNPDANDSGEDNVVAHVDAVTNNVFTPIDKNTQVDDTKDITTNPFNVVKTNNDVQQAGPTNIFTNVYNKVKFLKDKFKPSQLVKSNDTEKEKNQANKTG